MLCRELAGGVSLRPPGAGDAHELAAVVNANRSHLEPWMPWAHGVYDAARAREFIERSQRQIADEVGDAILVIRDGRVIGATGFVHIDRTNRSASLGYWLTAGAQGRGIATMATRALVEHGFDDRALHRVEIRAAVDNARSRAVAERCGFVFEGVLRGTELVGDVYLDHAVYGRLACD